MILLQWVNIIKVFKLSNENNKYYVIIFINVKVKCIIQS